MSALLPPSVAIDVHLEPRVSNRYARRLLVFVGVVPTGDAGVRQIAPQLVLPSPNDLSVRLAMHTLRITHLEQTDVLPGLDGVDSRGRSAPSRMRDAVRMALENGIESVEVALVSGARLRPWDLAPDPQEPEIPDVREIIDQYLRNRKGATIVLPDAGGPWRITTPQSTGPWEAVDTLERRCQRLVRQVKWLGPQLDAYHQLALVDQVPAFIQDTTYTGRVEELAGLDVAVCAWEGRPELAQLHGWRCAAAAVATTMVRGLSGTGGQAALRVPHVLGAKLNLHRGRVTTKSRDERLGRPVPSAATAPVHLATVRLESDASTATVRQDTAMRRPIGDWTLPELWVVKQVVRTILETADAFVFETATPGSAQALQFALQASLMGFARDGVLTGPGGVGGAVIETVARPDPIGPCLVVTIEATIMPWIRAIRLSVEVSDGGNTNLSVV